MIREKLENVENKIHNLIERYLFIIGIIIIFIISFAVRLHLAPITCLSGDYEGSLLPWIDYYKERGILQGLAESMGSYYVPYNLFLAFIAFLPGEPWMYISGFSILCDYVIAIFVYFISKELLEEAEGSYKRQTAAIAMVVSLLLPAAILNGSLWKQCDSVYTCFVVVSIYYVLKQRYSLSLAMLGIGFIFKLQAIYLLPLYVVLYIFRKKGLSIIHFIWIPIMYLLGGLPAAFAGRRIFDIYDAYYHQANYPGFDAMTMGMPNIYDFALTDYPALSKPALLLTLCIFILLACVIVKYKKGLNKINIFLIGIWSLWTCIMFLPAQHERYNYPVIILLSVFYIVTDIRKSWPAIVINIISCLQYGKYLFAAETVSYQVMAMFHIAAFLYVTYDMIKRVQEADAQFQVEKTT